MFNTVEPKNGSLMGNLRRRGKTKRGKYEFVNVHIFES